MENLLTKTIHNKSKNLLNIYFTAGYPNLEDTTTLLLALQDAKVDLIEIGIPFSDPVADGPTIQKSNAVALKNGMTLSLLFEQLYRIKSKINVPVILMGYFNPILQYGFEKFCADCAEIGISGLIVPDLPSKEYEAHYKLLFEKNKLSNIFLVTPNTSKERILDLDKISRGFIYAVSSSSITGNKNSSEMNSTYLEKFSKFNLQNPVLVGFNVKDKTSFEFVTKYTNGAIIGSAFIRMLEKSKTLTEDISEFIASIR